MNSILSPNRYTLEFLYTAIGEYPVNRINVSMFTPLKLLANWYKMYKVRSIHILNGDVILNRGSSVTSFLPIGP